MKSESLQLFLVIFLYTLLCSLMVCVSVLCVVDLLEVYHDFDKSGNMTLKALIEKEGVEKELLEVRTFVEMETSKLFEYLINNRFPKHRELEGDTYDDELKLIFLNIKELPLKFEQDVYAQIRDIFATRSGSELMEELRTIASIVPMLRAHFQIYEIDKEISRLDGVAKLKNQLVENIIQKIVDEIHEKRLKLWKSIVLEPCNAKSHSNCTENKELQETIKSIKNYLKQANESFQVLRQSDLHFEKRSFLIELMNHVQNINTSLEQYLELKDKTSS